MVMISTVIRTMDKHARIDCTVFNGVLGTYPPLNTYYIRLYAAVWAILAPPIVDSHSIILGMSLSLERIIAPLQHGSTRGRVE